MRAAAVPARREERSGRRRPAADGLARGGGRPDRRARDVDGISLRAIARQAGVSPTAVYRHFPDHSELLREVSDYCWTNLLQVLETARRSSTDPFISFDVPTARPTSVRPRPSRPIPGDVLEQARSRWRIVDRRARLFPVLLDDVTTMFGLLDDGRDPHIVAVQVHTWIHGIVDLSNSHPDVRGRGRPTCSSGSADALGLLPRGLNGATG